jgi:hypothetical protein
LIYLYIEGAIEKRPDMLQGEEFLLTIRASIAVSLCPMPSCMLDFGKALEIS